ncbi:hypothetical protein ACW9HR_15145 [Nocardia gipuzkoensis]
MTSLRTSVPAAARSPTKAAGAHRRGETKRGPGTTAADQQGRDHLDPAAPSEARTDDHR